MVGTKLLELKMKQQQEGLCLTCPTDSADDIKKCQLKFCKSCRKTDKHTRIKPRSFGDPDYDLHISPIKFFCVYCQKNITCTKDYSKLCIDCGEQYCDKHDVDFCALCR